MGSCVRSVQVGSYVRVQTVEVGLFVECTGGIMCQECTRWIICQECTGGIIFQGADCSGYF